MSPRSCPRTHSEDLRELREADPSRAYCCHWKPGNHLIPSKDCVTSHDGQKKQNRGLWGKLICSLIFTEYFWKTTLFVDKIPATKLAVLGNFRKGGAFCCAGTHSFRAKTVTPGCNCMPCQNSSLADPTIASNGRSKSTATYFAAFAVAEMAWNNQLGKSYSKFFSLKSGIQAPSQRERLRCASNRCCGKL